MTTSARPSRPRPDASPSLWRPGDPAVGLYVHVPFCRALCSYCTFAKGLLDVPAAWKWLETLEAEIAVRAASTWTGRPRLDTVFVGGGTPSALSPEQWERLGALLARGFEILPGAEFTAEANPESFEETIARAMRRAGVNRVSLGSQSFDPEELRLLGRIHDADAPARALTVAREAGFGNVNLDLMYGLPGQTVERFARNLDTAVALAPEHLSAYCLSLEPGTPLTASVASGALARPDEDRSAAMYEILVARTGEAGYAHYEISNFAREGRESRHNLRYWMRRDVIALGPSAHGLLGGCRWANPATLEGWARAYGGDAGPPPPKPVALEEARFEWIFLHLRLARGLSRDEYAAAWSEPFESRYGAVARRLEEGGLLETSGDRLRLTPRARFLSDAVFTEFAP